MRKTEIETFAREHPEMVAPTYRQLDSWTRDGLLTVSMKGDRHGLYRDWAADEVAVAFLVARLVDLGFSVELAFHLARTKPDAEGVRSLILDGADRPMVTVSVGAE